MARPFRHRPALSDLPKGAERELIEQFRDIESNLDELRSSGSATPMLRVRTYAPKLGELVLLEPPPEGTLLMLPAGSPENISKTILVAVVGGVLSPGVTVSIVGRKGVINGAATMTLGSLCLVEFVSCGARGWFSCCTGGGGGGGGTAEAAYPVGSIYLSTNGTNPATTLGFGTWSAFGAGRVPVGFDSGQTEFDTDEETGGAKTVAGAGSNSAPAFTGTASQSTSSNSAGTPAGTNSAPTFTGNALGTHTHTFTGNALGNHAHELPFQKVAGGTGVLRMLASSVFGTGTSRAAESQSAAPVANTTSAAVELSQAVSAGTPSGTNASVSAGTPSGTVSAPTFTGSAMAGHSHTITPSGTVSAPTFTGSPTSVLQPYIVVRMWKRTA